LGERLSPLDVGTFWLGTTPQHYRKPWPGKNYSSQRPNFIRYKKLIHRPMASKTTKIGSAKTRVLFVAGHICCQTPFFFQLSLGTTSVPQVLCVAEPTPNS